MCNKVKYYAFYPSVKWTLLLVYDCTQGKKVTCLLKPGMKTGKNHSLNDVNLI
jgi:hypothetical protein